MASSTLFPPLLENSAPAFLKADGCTIKWELSKYSTYTGTIKRVHIQVYDQSTGDSVVNTSTYPLGYIVALYDSTNSYTIKDTEDVTWTEGNTYYIKIRLDIAETNYDGSEEWQKDHASDFTEWSQYCYTKCIIAPKWTVSSEHNLKNSFPIISISYSSDDANEYLYSYELYNDDKSFYVSETGLKKEVDKNDTSKAIHTKNYIYNQLLQEANVTLHYTYTTVNNYSISSTETIKPAAEDKSELKATFSPIYLDENENGRLKINIDGLDATTPEKYFIMRSSDGGETYQSLTGADTALKTSSYYDYLIEDSQDYIYLIQENAAKSCNTDSIALPQSRDFEFAYLVGKDGRQIALKYNQNIGSYVYNVTDTKTDTIGGQFPFISRNGDMYYRTFNINGLISFEMDNNKLFIDMDKLNTKNNRHKERLFREELLSFLQDGEIKLFKSPTEGNIIIRLMSVNCQPNESLSRLVYSFTSQAVEVMEATDENIINNFTNGGGAS